MDIPERGNTGNAVSVPPFSKHRWYCVAEPAKPAQYSALLWCGDGDTWWHREAGPNTYRAPGTRGCDGGALTWLCDALWCCPPNRKLYHQREHADRSSETRLVANCIQGVTVAVGLTMCTLRVSAVWWGLPGLCSVEWQDDASIGKHIEWSSHSPVELLSCYLPGARNLSQDRRCPSQDSNRAPPEYKSGALVLGQPAQWYHH